MEATRTTKYSSLDQINAAVKDLKVVWEWKGQNSGGVPTSAGK
jgi:hypothetical protein